MKKQGNRRWFVWGFLLIVILILANIWALYSAFFSPSDKNSPHINLNPISATSLVFKAAKQESLLSWDSPKSILILGRSGGDYLAPHLTDSIMVLYVDPRGRSPKAKIISIPRDLLVRLDDPERFLKINALWQHSQESTEDSIGTVKEKIEDIISLQINSVLLFELETVKSVVEEIDGVTVFVKENIYDPQFPKEGGGIETFALQKGWRYLGASDAIKFIRTRYSPLGDFDRIARQQEVLKSVKGKLASLNPIWNLPTIWSVFSTLRNEIITDLTFSDIQNLWAVGQGLALNDIETFSLDTSTGLVKAKTTHFAGIPSYTLVATEEPFDYAKIQEAVQSFLLE